MLYLAYLLIVIIITLLPLLTTAQLTPGQLLRVKADGVHFELSSNYVVPQDTSTTIASIHRADSIANKLAKYTDSIATALATVMNASLGLKLNCVDTSHGTGQKVMTRYVADSSISVIMTAIGLKYDASNPSHYIASTDTAAMLNNYRSGVNGNTAAITANTASINNKVAITDTANMLAPYAKVSSVSGKLNASDTASLSNRINTKVNIADTSGMLLNYRNGINSNTASIGLKINATDTAFMLIKYLRKQDTAAMLLPYAKTNQIPVITGKVNVSDTAAMLAPYAKVNSIPTVNNSTVLAAIGYTPLQSSALTPYKLISDSGRGITNYATGYDLNKVRDSLAAIMLQLPTVSIATRTLNSNFTISSTRPVLATYTLTASTTNPLLVGSSTATAYLEYSLNAGSTWNLPAQMGGSSAVGITVTLQLTSGNTGIVAGWIPANGLVRIRTTTTGTGSVSYVSGQEIVF